MKSRLIQQQDWKSEFADISKRNEGRLATLSIVDRSFGAQIEARGLPFEGISPDGKGGGIVLQLGTAAGGNVEHPVVDPSQVWLGVDDQGVEAALEILSGGGRKTIVEFRPS